MPAKFVRATFSRTTLRILAYGLCMVLGVSKSQAQTTTCMAMGPDMMTCNSTPYGDGGAALGRGIGNLIRGIGEKSFRKKIGQMLANGDCQGASRYAYEKGRLELGTSIAQSCAPRRSSSFGPRPMGLQEKVLKLATDTPTPATLDDVTTLTQVEAYGTQLRLTATINTDGATMSGPVAQKTNETLCSIPSLAEIMRSGGSVRATYVRKDGSAIGAVTTTRQSCGY